MKILFSLFFVCSLIVNAAKQTKDRYLTKWLLHPVGLICLSKKIPEPFS
jgi:general stress protein CsbA